MKRYILDIGQWWSTCHTLVAPRSFEGDGDIMGLEISTSVIQTTCTIRNHEKVLWFIKNYCSKQNFGLDIQLSLSTCCDMCIQMITCVDTWLGLWCFSSIRRWKSEQRTLSPRKVCSLPFLMLAHVRIRTYVCMSVFELSARVKFGKAAVPLQAVELSVRIWPWKLIRETHHIKRLFKELTQRDFCLIICVYIRVSRSLQSREHLRAIHQLSVMQQQTTYRISRCRGEKWRRNPCNCKRRNVWIIPSWSQACIPKV